MERLTGASTHFYFLQTCEIASTMLGGRILNTVIMTIWITLVLSGHTIKYMYCVVDELFRHLHHKMKGRKL